MEAEKILGKVVQTLDKKKAKDIKVLKIDDLTVISDYFVIATATSTTQLKALSNEIEFELEKENVNCEHKEGFESASWILLDYSSVIVHLFLQDSRMFYSLERLWNEAKEEDIKKYLKEEE